MMGRGANIFRRITEVGVSIGGVFLVGAMVLMVASIIVRLFGGGIKFTYEVSELMAVVTITFALAYTALRRGHVVVDMVISRFSQRTQAIVESFTLLLSIGTWVVIIWASIMLMGERVGIERTALLEIPVFPFRLVWVFGLLILCLLLSTDLVKVLRETKRK